MNNGPVIDTDSGNALALAKYKSIDRMLVECSTPLDFKKVADVAAAALEYARRVKATRETFSLILGARIDALTGLGQSLANTPKAKGGAEPGVGRRGKQNAVVSNDSIIESASLQSIGITRDESAQSQALARAKEEKPRLYQYAREGIISLRQVARIMAKKFKREERKQHTIEAVTAESLDVRHCSCAELFASSIQPQVVFTDPPYERKSLECYTELAKACIDVPVVAVMTGHLFLPEVFTRLCAHLNYRWVLAYLTPGGQSVQAWPAKVNTFWKPVLLFGESFAWLGDVARSDVNDNDKDHHHWGQSESGITDVLRRLVNPGDLVCDPFCGAGTTAVAALKLGCRFVGCDIDKACVEKTRGRFI